MADLPDVLRVTRTCAIPLNELTWRFGPSGGPGGQHANRANTRVELRFDVAESPSLGPRQRARLQDRLGDVVRVVVDEQRSQARNRAIALDRLRDRLASGLREPRPRRPTAPSAGANERRLAAKRRRARLKQDRAKSGNDGG